MSLVALARSTHGHVCSRFRTRPAVTLSLCRQTSFIGPATVSAARVQERDEPIRRIMQAALVTPPLV